jgi:hypothetical protein
LPLREALRRKFEGRSTEAIPDCLGPLLGPDDPFRVGPTRQRFPVSL